MFQEYAVVRLKNALSSVPLPVGTKGAVLIVHTSDPPAYEVEFVDHRGESLGTYTIRDEDLISDE